MRCIESASYIGGDDFVCELEPLQRQLRRQRETSEVENNVVAPVFMRWRCNRLASVNEWQTDGEVVSSP